MNEKTKKQQTKDAELDGIAVELHRETHSSTFNFKDAVKALLMWERSPEDVMDKKP